MQNALILIVEDDKQVLDIAMRALRRIEMQCIGVGSIAAAQAIVATRVPDVLVTDIELGDGNGLALAQGIWTWYPTLPVVFMSGGVTVDCRAMGDAVPGRWCRYIGKPFVPNALYETVKEALAAARATRLAGDHFAKAFPTIHPPPP